MGHPIMVHLRVRWCIHIYVCSVVMILCSVCGGVPQPLVPMLLFRSCCDVSSRVFAVCQALRAPMRDLCTILTGSMGWS